MGVPPGDAAVCADVLVTADIWGIESHGIAHLPMYYDRIRSGIQKPVTLSRLVSDRAATAVIDGGNGMGMVVARQAMNLAIHKARQHGIASVAVSDSSHFGVAGYYARMACEQGMIGISVTNAQPAIAPTHGSSPMLGTNPIAVGVPTDEPFPFLFDASTSVVARGKLEIAAREQTPVPDGWTVPCSKGAPPRNLDHAIDLGQAALLPLGGLGELFGGHKGYGLAAVVEILCTALQNQQEHAPLSHVDHHGFRRVGHCFTAINVEHFVPLAAFRSTAGSMMRDLRRSPKLPGQTRIFTAGEKEYENSLRVRERGIALSAPVLRSLRDLSTTLQLPQQTFPQNRCLE